MHNSNIELTNVFVDIVERDDNVAVKIRGFPWSVTDEDVITFFDGYKIVPDSIKIERDDENNGRITGWGAALFETEEEAARAIEERQKESIGSRWLQLYPLQYGRYQTFGVPQ